MLCATKTRDWTHVPCTASCILNHWTAREALFQYFNFPFSSWIWETSFLNINLVFDTMFYVSYTHLMNNFVSYILIATSSFSDLFWFGLSVASYCLLFLLFRQPIHSFLSLMTQRLYVLFLYYWRLCKEFFKVMLEHRCSFFIHSKKDTILCLFLHVQGNLSLPPDTNLSI